MSSRQLTFTDSLITNLDRALRTVAGVSTAERRSPAEAVSGDALDDDQRRLAARLMRVNHTGEVCAQALYHGQALTARLSDVREDMESAADEECDHLAWCEQRLDELGSRTSVLNPLFYAGSFAIGAVAGIAGDRWSLGFVAETEDQVVRHLEGHLKRVPTEDRKSRAVLQQMCDEESRHADRAREAGGARLPFPVRIAMRLSSKMMTSTTYWV